MLHVREAPIHLQKKTGPRLAPPDFALSGARSVFVGRKHRLEPHFRRHKQLLTILSW